MNFDFHGWVATEANAGRTVAASPSGPAASGGMAATSAGLSAVMGDKLKREEKREEWRKSVRLPDHSGFRKIYDACWSLPDSIEAAWI